jgi:uncharacterized protein
VFDRGYDPSVSGLRPTVGAGGASVRVLGEARIRTEPDEAFIWITLTAVHESPGAALTDVASRNSALVALLDELEISSESRSTTGVTVGEEFDYTGDGRRSLGHRAVASMSVRLADMDLIGRVLMRASTELDARIAGPSWRVSPANPAWLRAASQASRNAKTKAEAYAAGVDARLGPLLSLSEPDDSHGYGIPMAARAAAGGPDMHIEPAEQEVVATIQATFELVPDFGHSGPVTAS